MQRPEAVLFDLWGTLISSEGFDAGLGKAAVLKTCDNPHGVTLEQVLELGDHVMTALDTREDQSALEFSQASLLRIIGDSLDLRFRNSMEETEWDFWSAALDVRLIDGVREPHGSDQQLLIRGRHARERAAEAGDTGVFRVRDLQRRLRHPQARPHHL